MTDSGESFYLFENERKEGETKAAKCDYMKFLESVKLQMKKRSRKHIGNWQRNIIQI